MLQRCNLESTSSALYFVALIEIYYWSCLFDRALVWRIRGISYILHILLLCVTFSWTHPPTGMLRRWTTCHVESHRRCRIGGWHRTLRSKIDGSPFSLWGQIWFFNYIWTHILEEWVGFLLFPFLIRFDNAHPNLSTFRRDDRTCVLSVVLHCQP